jgi:hypothetical protein
MGCDARFEIKRVSRISKGLAPDESERGRRTEGNKILIKAQHPRVAHAMLDSTKS